MVQSANPVINLGLVGRHVVDEPTVFRLLRHWPIAQAWVSADQRFRQLEVGSVVAQHHKQRLEADGREGTQNDEVNSVEQDQVPWNGSAKGWVDNEAVGTVS